MPSTYHGPCCLVYVLLLRIKLHRPCTAPALGEPRAFEFEELLANGRASVTAPVVAKSVPPSVECTVAQATEAPATVKPATATHTTAVNQVNTQDACATLETHGVDTAETKSSGGTYSTRD